MNRALTQCRARVGIATAIATVTALAVAAGCSTHHAASVPTEAGPAPAVTRSIANPPVANLPAANPQTAPPIPPRPIIPAAPRVRPTDTILVAGESVSAGTRVVLFDEPGAYDAYRGPAYYNQRRDETLPASATEPAASPPPDRAALDRLIDRVVIHYDVSGLSSRCFRTLQEERGLSCHFLLDVDGTVYQTLDLQERAWHAGTSNSRSVGIEIANVGAYPKGSANPFARWYRPHAQRGTRLVLPPDSGVRHPGRVGGPARPDPVTGPIHGRQFVQYDLTDAQYNALIKLVAALCRTFPRVTPDAPRVGGDPAGPVLPGLMTAADRVRFGGIVGHHHLTRDKIDPGPAFDWPRLLRGVRSDLRKAPEGSPSGPDPAP